MTPLTDLLEIDLPLVQAPMAGVQGSRLALAVSNAGALGSLPGAMLDAEALRRQLALIRSGTNRPYNVNFFCHAPPIASVEQQRAWRRTLQPYYEELGIDAQPVPAGPSRAPFSQDMADVLEEFRPPVVSFHFGLPSAQLLQRLKTWGARILSSATTVQEARWLQDRGVDAIIAQGWEAGGHRGHFLAEDLTAQIGTFALVRRIVQAVQLPVIAAGGIADAEGVAAALRLGAAGAQIGTAWLLCPEADTHPVHRAALTDERAGHTAVTNLFSGRPARGIVNRLMRELRPFNVTAPAFPLAAAGIAPLRAAAERSGCDDFSPLWCGQNPGGCRHAPAAELTRILSAQLP